MDWQIDDLLVECERSLEKNDLSRLSWACDRILEIDAVNERALEYRTQCFLESHQYHLVSDICRKIRRLYPANVRADEFEASAYLGRKEFEKALELCEGVETNENIKALKTRALISLERIDEAYEFHTSSGLSEYPFYRALIGCGKYSQISGYEKDDDLLGCLLKRCEYLKRWGRPEEILEVCREIFKIDKDNEIAWGYRLYALEGRIDDEAFLGEVDRALKLYPDNYCFCFRKAETLYCLGDIDESIKYFENGFSAGVKVYYSFFQALEVKAERERNDGNFMGAIGMYEKILSHDPFRFSALDDIDAIASEHDIIYEPSESYCETFNLRKKAKKRAEEIEDCLSGIVIGEYGEDYASGCDSFKDYGSIDEYIRDIIIVLMESYPGHSEEESRFLVKCNMEYIKSSFEYGEPAAYCSIEVGYCCG